MSIIITRQHLEIVRAVDRAGTITRASEELFLTQSALSHAIAKLEAELDVSLWERQGRGVQLTQAGAHLLGVASRVLPLLEHAEETLRAFGEGKRGRLRLGMECHPCYHWILPAVSRFLEAWPSVDLDVIQRFQFSGIEALKRNEVDLIVTPDPVNDPELQVERLFQYELRLVVSRESRLADRDYLEPDDLRDVDLLCYPVPRERLDIFTHFLTPAAVEPHGLTPVEATEILLQLVAAGRGATPLPDWMVEKYRHLPIVSLRLGRDGIHKELALMHRTGELPAYGKGFVGIARDASRPGGRSEPGESTG